MRNYWIAVHHPDGYDPAIEEDDAMRRDIGALNDEMEAAQVRVFVGGMEPPGNAKTLRRQADGRVLITGGPCLRATEHVCGFWVLKVSSPEEALAWGQNERRRTVQSGADRHLPAGRLFALVRAARVRRTAGLKSSRPSACS